MEFSPRISQNLKVVVVDSKNISIHGSGHNVNAPIVKILEEKPSTIHKIFETNSSFHVDSALREKFNFSFLAVFASIDKIFILGGRLSIRL